MIFGMSLLSFGIFVAVIAGTAAWFIRLTWRPREVRLEKPKPMAGRQPWDTDKAGGRGNR